MLIRKIFESRLSEMPLPGLWGEILQNSDGQKTTLSVAEIHFFQWGGGGGGAKPSKFPTKLSNFRQTPPFALEKVVFSPLLGQNFRKFVIFHEDGGGGGGPPPPRPT